eukprot:CAMPEP_0177346600 /NCGR_PEP_ID=MMETSP0368-20130122/29272_1 /TAXON_ID=447022 ORGANISM="Scrippsiella hangoei-like, Strain SHHI-4" /NCGR_SAMPLE_ID=MMETSP0368 /ASSEMBLY_ACC=CAM_ASM_000363 /LENGTH=382 /DNA_ID=CAMNT_0018808263 /DNA_START=46 /DNA_END=1191 /DNA_ORIENTATION=-
MAYGANALDGPCPAPYVVRNTFVDWAPAEDQDPAGGVFSTWHHPARGPSEGADPEDLPSTHSSPSKPAQQRRQALRRPSRQGDAHSAQAQPAFGLLGGAAEGRRRAPGGRSGGPSRQLEDGEVISEGTLEEGELPDDGELSAEEDDVGSSSARPRAGCSAGSEASSGGGVAEEGVPGESSGPPSRGSAGHARGACRPCAWLHKSADGCRHGANCEYCHLCPAGEIKRRKQEKLQRRYLEIVMAKQKASLANGIAPQDVGMHVAAGASPPGVRLQAMEPCYIELPGVAPAPSANGNPGRQVRSSLGSVEHVAGLCKPCAWVHKDANGCKHGASCSYCHLCPPGELRRRKREKWEAQQHEAARAAAAAAEEASPLAPLSPGSSA